MKSRKSFSDLPVEVVMHISNYLNYQSCESLGIANKNLFTKFGGKFFANSDKILVGDYLNTRKGEMIGIPEKLILAAKQGCLDYLDKIYFKCVVVEMDECDDTYYYLKSETPHTKGTNRAVWFLNIFSKCSINFCMFSLFSLLNEHNGQNLKNSVLSSIKKQLAQDGWNEKLIPNLKKYLLKKYIYEEDMIKNLMEILIDYIHQENSGYTVLLDGSTYKYRDITDGVRKLEQELLLMPNTFLPKSACIVM